MNYEQYIPKFIEKPNRAVFFPPLLPDRWSNYPSAQAILQKDAEFYQDPTINPNAKSREFRKAVAADWASDQVKYNPHYFTRFPYGLARNNIADSTFNQTSYLKGMQDDDWIYAKKDAEAEDYEAADAEINPPAHLNTNLINNLIIPYIAGEALNMQNTPTQRRRMLAETKYPEKDAFYWISKRTGVGGYADIVDKRLKEQKVMLDPRYLNEPFESLGWTDTLNINPTDNQLEAIRSYRSLIDRASGVDSDVPWQYKFE